MNRTVSISTLPTEIRVEDAVESACAADISFIDERLRRGSSVLVECDKELSLFLYLAVRARMRRTKDAPRMVIIDGRPQPDDPPKTIMARMMDQLTAAIRESTERTIIVMLHLDVLTTTHTGLTMEARESIPLLYENPEAVVLGFRDPSFEVPKVIRDVFAAKREITGIPRETLPKLITQREAKSLHATEFDPFGMYPYVSGLNPVQIRKIFSEFTTRREAPAGRPLAMDVYKEIRKMTAADDIELPNVDMEKDIGGYEAVKAKINDDLIGLIKRKQEMTSESDIQQMESLLPRGIIFFGAPGTGKSFFAKAIATTINATVIVVSGPELKSKWVGESEANLRNIFRKARAAAPSIIIFDEIDAFAHQRGTYQGSGVEHSMVNQLLTEMDGFRKNEMVFVVGTTNFLESLDGALMRPGRFEFMIEIAAPNPEDRTAIIKIYDKKFALGLNDELIAHMVRRTEGLADREKGIPFSGDHIYAVCRALKRQVLRSGATTITTDDIDKALQRKTSRKITLDATEEKVIAVHEAGHAIVAMLMPKAMQPERISIVSDMEGALGYVMRAAKTRPYTMTSEEMFSEICVALGGQVAEREIFDDVSVGAYADLQQANSIARMMVEQYGMTKNLGGRVVLDHDAKHGIQPSEDRRKRIDAEIDRILDEARTKVEMLIRTRKEDHEELYTLILGAKLLEKDAINAFKSMISARANGTVS